MKVLLFTLEFPPVQGGAGQVALNLIKGYSDSDSFVELDVLTVKTQVSFGSEVKFWNRVFPISFWYLWSPIYFMSIILLDRKRPDVVLIWNYYSFLVVPLWFLNLFSLKSIYVIHGPELNYLVRPFKLRDRIFGSFNLLNRKLRYFSKIVLVSEPYLVKAKNLLPELSHKFRHIPNGVPIQESQKEILSRNSKGTKYLVVGRLVALKRVDIVISAFIKSGLSLKSCELVVVGDGPCRGELEGLAKGEGNISFKGNLRSEEVYEIYRDSDYLIAFSDNSESFGLTIIEAASLGVPSITSGVFRDNGVIIDHVTGLVSKDDSLESLVDALLYSHHSKLDIWHGLSMAARRFVFEKYSHEEMYKRYLGLIYED